MAFNGLVFIWFASFLVGIHGTVSPTYFLDDAGGLGRQYDGIGAISGGGATSRLLVNYPQNLRDQILDYLFKPNFGAALQIFKVEIGGDSQTTDGTESSHMHEEWDENYFRGYEWWLMKEAKKRNPGIKLYGLPWAFPGWIAKGHLDPYVYPNITAMYVVKWVMGAQKHHNLTIDYLGIWNERPYNVKYVKVLRATLDQFGFSKVKLVAADGSWSVSTDILNDKSFAAVVDYIGVHYPGTYSSFEAKATKKQLWSSEDYSTFNDDTGAGCWARILNQNYVNGYMTSTISWNLIASYYNDLPFTRNGLMTANQPWSGHYVVDIPVWVTAHTTQFTSIGWSYLLHGAGVGHLLNGGSYVSLTSPDKKNLTLVIETMSHDHSICVRPTLPPYTVKPQNATFELRGSFVDIKSLNVWYTKLNFSGDSTVFKKLPPVKVINGAFSLQLDVDVLYTLTTSDGGVKGAYPDPPVPAPFPLPYKENFESYPQDNLEPNNFAQQIGVFEVHTVLDYTYKKTMKQVVLNNPIDWCPQKLKAPINVIGSEFWSDISVKVDVNIPFTNGTDGAFVAARVDRGGCTSFAAQGIFFWVFPNAKQSPARYEISRDLARVESITSGNLTMGFDQFHTLTLTIQDGRVLAYFDGFMIVSQALRSTVSKQGFVAVGTNNFGYAYYDNLEIKSPTIPNNRLKFHTYHKSDSIKNRIVDSRKMK